MAPGLSADTALPAIDWSAPWLAPYRKVGQALALQIESGWPVHTVLTAAPSAPIQFVPQTELPAGTAYEKFIFDTGCVPTRANLHDFFNGLVWLHLPQTKRRLNQLQAQAIAQHGIGPVRGPLRDALTLFDENGALLDAPQPLWQALRARQWHRLFVELRPLWREARLLLFGHALLEQLVSPRKPLTAHVYCAHAAMNSGADWEEWLPHELQAEHLATKPFTPMPVLGVPGWWPGNEDFSFYDDPRVFRSARTA